MRVEEYLEQMQALGIARGAFEGGFPPHTPSSFNHESTTRAVDYSVPLKVVPPPISEDLSRFMTPSGGRPITEKERWARALARCKPELRPFYESLKARGESIDGLAAKTGLNKTVILHGVGGQGVSDRTIKLIWPLLNRKERGVLQWPRKRREGMRVKATVAQVRS